MEMSEAESKANLQEKENKEQPEEHKQVQDLSQSSAEPLAEGKEVYNPYLDKNVSLEENKEEELKEEVKGEVEDGEEKVISKEEEELLKYVEDMLLMISTADEEFNAKNIELLSEQIFQGLKRAKKNNKNLPDIQKEQIKLFLEELKNEHQRILREEGEVNTRRLLQVLRAQQEKENNPSFLEGADLYNLGAKSYSATTIWLYTSNMLSAGSTSAKAFTQGYLGSATWITVGLFYTAQTGLNYRRLKTGTISRNEFWRRVKMNSVTAVSSLAVGTGGAAAGFAIGSFLFPGIGSIIGAVVGGIAGGIAGEKISTKFYISVEKRIEEAKRLRELERQREAGNPISEERLTEALALFGLSIYDQEGAKFTMLQVEERYLAVTEKVSRDKVESERHFEEQRRERGEVEEEEPAGIEERHQQFLDKMEQICNAFEDVKLYWEFEQMVLKAEEINDEEEDLVEVEMESVAGEEEVTTDGQDIQDIRQQQEQEKPAWKRIFNFF